MINIEIQTLPIEQKLALMEQLWDAISNEKPPLASPAWHEDIVTARLAKLSAGTENTFSLQEAKRRLKL